MGKLLGSVFAVALVVATIFSHMFWPDSRWVTVKWYGMDLGFTVVLAGMVMVLLLGAAAWPGSHHHEGRKRI
jgi:hypothetical protein